MRVRSQAALRPDRARTLSFALEQSQYVLQLLAELPQTLRRRFRRLGRAMRGPGRPRARRGGTVLRQPPRRELLPRSSNRESVFVEKLSDLKKQLYVLGSVGSLAGLVLGGRQGGKLGFPVAKDVSLDADDLTDFTNAVIKLLRLELHGT